MDLNNTELKLISPLVTNIPHCITLLPLPRRIRWLGYDRHGRHLDIQLGNLNLEINNSRTIKPQTLRQKIPFLSKNRKLILYYRRLSWKIQMLEWHLLNGHDRITDKRKHPAQVEIKKSKRQYFFNQMGTFISRTLG